MASDGGAGWQPENIAEIPIIAVRIIVQYISLLNFDFIFSPCLIIDFQPSY